MSYEKPEPYKHLGMEACFCEDAAAVVAQLNVRQPRVICKSLPGISDRLACFSCFCPAGVPAILQNLSLISEILN